jgi:hypothetical protein
MRFQMVRQPATFQVHFIEIQDSLLFDTRLGLVFAAAAQAGCRVLVTI